MARTVLSILHILANLRPTRVYEVGISITFIYRFLNWHREVSNLSRVTWLVSGRLKIQTQPD